VRQDKQASHQPTCSSVNIGLGPVGDDLTDGHGF